MKILTGLLRGQRIAFRPNPHLRPTSDKARKAIFDMFQGQMEGRRVLDLFSGTGALGLEALSQGAQHVTFVDHDKNQCREITDNLTRLKLIEKAAVRCESALEFLSHADKSGGQGYDFVFVDPPYDDEVSLSAMEGLGQMKRLAKDSFVLLECRKRRDFPEVIGSLKLLRDKRYGQTKILIYRSCG